MPVPRSLIVPDSKPPVLLLGAGALLLAGLVIRTLRRRRGRASRRGDIVLGTWRTAVPQASALMEGPVARMRLEQGAQKRGRAVKKRP